MTTTNIYSWEMAGTFNDVSYSTGSVTDVAVWLRGEAQGIDPVEVMMGIIQDLFVATTDKFTWWDIKVTRGITQT